MKVILIMIVSILLTGCESYHVEQNSRNGPSCESSKKEGVLFSYEQCNIYDLDHQSKKIEK